MMKRKLHESNPGSMKKPNTGSSAVRSGTQELLTSRGTPRFEDAVLSTMFGISSALGAMSRAQEVLLDKIESIALKVGTLEKEVLSMKERLPPRPQEMPRPLPSWLPSNEEIREWLNSPKNSPERICSPDLTCSEMPYLSNLQSIDHQLMSDGSMDSQEWESLDWHIALCQEPTSKSPEPSGGMDTYVKKM